MNNNSKGSNLFNTINNQNKGNLLFCPSVGENRNNSLFGSNISTKSTKNSLFNLSLPLEKGNESTDNKNIPLFGSKAEETLDSKNIMKDSLFGNNKKEQKEIGKDNISLFGQENKIEDAKKSASFEKLADLFIRLSKSFENNNVKAFNIFSSPENNNENKKNSKSIFDSNNNVDNDKIEQEKKSSDNNQSKVEPFFSNIFSFNDKNNKNKTNKSINIFSSNSENKENKKNEIPLQNNLIYIREYTNKDKSKIKVYKFESDSPENLLNIEKVIFHHLENNFEKKKEINQFQSEESEEKLDDKNIKINCEIMEPKKKSFSIKLYSSNDIGFLKLLICLELNKDDNFHNIKSNTFCLMKNYCFIKETGTVEDCGINDGDNIYIIHKDIMKKYIEDEIN